ncbi:extracellular catalytic domain type 1 short-chain-length polyhydroxyalkanoate depolymerase [Derxia gummosa]|uniref:Extracellular catalytic domain type 1 short-chain-length polyhydroxyalkanoate depolymerase n=1 Tax=Derxia gummosa DSM 723 TaxID=1121388 RepID=A0A8B6X716_9BURK|nr:PHB depolymerase family esterase [Derxia gummosa]
MNSFLRQLLSDASQLAHSADLQHAADAMRKAFDGLLHGHRADAIDVTAHELRDTPAAATPRDGATPPRLGQLVEGRHAEDGGARRYKLFIPAAAGTRPLPLVVMLHGCTQDEDDFITATRMNAAALAADCFVLWPRQSRRANGTRCWNWYLPAHQKRGAGEPGLIAGMTRAVMAAQAIDPTRVYVAGLSAGGAMAAILGAEYPELFAAVGVHSGLPPGAADDATSAFAAMSGGTPVHHHPAHLPPTIVFHGDQDRTVAPVNGERVAALAAGGLPATRDTASLGGRDVTRRVWRDAAGHARAEHWLVHGEGHTWFGGEPHASFASGAGPDATREMLRFFGEQRLAKATRAA